MWDTPNNKLSEDEIEDIQKNFDDFYRLYVDNVTPSILDFVESINEQFTESKYLSEKQISALNNIIYNCEDQYEKGYES